jgi:hypothetical protein
MHLFSPLNLNPSLLRPSATPAYISSVYITRGTLSPTSRIKVPDQSLGFRGAILRVAVNKSAVTASLPAKIVSSNAPACVSGAVFNAHL